MLTALFVAARIIANPVSNVFQKQLAHRNSDPLFIIAATHALLTLPCALFLIYAPRLGTSPGFWSNIIIAAALAVCGNVLLVHALKAGDLSVLGPINAYKALISVGLGIFLIGETPSMAGVAGMLLILGGSYFVLGGSTASSAVTGGASDAVETLTAATAGHSRVRPGAIGAVPLRLSALAFS